MNPEQNRDQQNREQERESESSTAVQELRGLKLEATTGPVDVLVVERVEKARGN